MHTCSTQEIWDKGTALAPDRPQLAASRTWYHPDVIVLTPQGTGQHLCHSNRFIRDSCVNLPGDWSWSTISL